MYYIYQHSITSPLCIVFCRLLLAALHYNENSTRAQAVTKEGEKRYSVNFPKYKKGDYVVKKIKMAATFGERACVGQFFHVVAGNSTITMLCLKHLALYLRVALVHLHTLVLLPVVV